MNWVVIILSCIILFRALFFSSPLIYFSLGKSKLLSGCALGLFCTVLLYNVSVNYGFIFSMADAVVSWNRWAIELSNNFFQPYDAAYPILFPGIWSLIYEAQGTSEIWSSAKLTLLALPIVLIVICASLFAENRLPSALIFSSTTLFVLFFEFEQLTNGWMDFPLAGITLCGLFLVCETIRKDKIGPKEKDLLLFAAICLGLAAVTKQAGVLGLIVVVFVTLQAVRKKELGVFEALKIISIAFLPIVFFYIIFEQSEKSMIGLLPIWKGMLVEDVFLRHYVSARMLIGSMSWALLVILAILLVSVPIKELRSPIDFFLKLIQNRHFQVALLFLLISLVGFFIFANCCSYAARNGIWILMYLVAMAMLGVVGFERKLNIKSIPKQIVITSKSLILGSIAFALITSFATSLAVSDEEILNIQHTRQMELGNQDVNEVILAHIDLIEDSGRIVSAYSWIRWLPEIAKDKYVDCRSDNCLSQVLKLHPHSLVLTDDIYPYLEFEDNMSKNKIIGTSSGYKLYYTGSID
ncbi:hypothetical protein [Lentilitoribacter sp. Alg239-R112]|uniref:hypothetical protein n=1 Tax=Lentilitoribacter sp. Alg239-R112 TaxID=2305987 RepID=UPI0013A6E0E6|nr:hypothetical protein [Lentilitoribacter sp. Alg239-R112]